MISTTNALLGQGARGIVEVAQRRSHLADLAKWRSSYQTALGRGLLADSGLDRFACFGDTIARGVELLAPAFLSADLIKNLEAYCTACSLRHTCWADGLPPAPML